MNHAIRIAMWSGPRNISTAMMRAWGNRPDTFVVDEPFYAHYLQETGADHPGREEVIAQGETDWRKVVEKLTAAVPQDRAVFYQKQMTHHLLPTIERDWLLGLTNCFLIRDPLDVIVSYLKKNPEPQLSDLGFMQQAEIYDWLRMRGVTLLPVIDARDILEDPKRILELLCDAVGVDFTDKMLSWPPGLRETDGVWAKHWYPEVETSTSFRPYRTKHDALPERLHSVYESCRQVYERLYADRLH